MKLLENLWGKLVSSLVKNDVKLDLSIGIKVEVNGIIGTLVDINGDDTGVIRLFDGARASIVLSKARPFPIKQLD